MSETLQKKMGSKERGKGDGFAGFIKEISRSVLERLDLGDVEINLEQVQYLVLFLVMSALLGGTVDLSYAGDSVDKLRKKVQQLISQSIKDGKTINTGEIQEMIKR
jgi:hypothetical protein